MEISKTQIHAAEHILVDNGIEQDEAATVLQAIGYALLGEELYPDGKAQIVEAMFASVWDNGSMRLRTPCKVNMETREVFDIVQYDEEDVLNSVSVLDAEYVELPDGSVERVYPRDEAVLEDQYWVDD